MSDHCRCPGFSDHLLNVMGKISSNRACAHGTAVATGSFAVKDPASSFSPRNAVTYRPEDTVRGAAVAAIRLSAVVTRKGGRECIRVDPALVCEQAYNSAGHHRVIGEKPRCRWRIAFFQALLNY